MWYSDCTKNCPLRPLRAPRRFRNPKISQQLGAQPTPRFRVMIDHIVRIARRQGCAAAHVNCVDGMNLPERDALRVWPLAVPARRVACVEEELTDDANRMAKGGLGDLLPGRWAEVGADLRRGRIAQVSRTRQISSSRLEQGREDSQHYGTKTVK